MQKIDKDKFLFLFTNEFGQLNKSQNSGLSFILDQLMLDDKVSDIRWAAYMLATTYHETAKTLQPVSEYDKGKGKPYGIPDPKTGHVYYGRGYVQLTWADNYKTMGKTLGIDLYNEPDKTKTPDVAYAIMSLGMRRAMFTGVGLSKYINDKGCDYHNARKIINGLDCADRIEGYAIKIEKMITESII